MNFKVGDKVKFLNENGGGIISKVISSSLVNVTIEDGFDIPTLTSDLVKIEEPTSSAGRFFTEDMDKKLDQIQPAQEPEERTSTDQFDQKISSLRQSAGRGRMNEGIYLAFVPQDQKILVAGQLDLYLINHSEYEVIYNLFLNNSDGTYTGKDYDVVPASSRCKVATFDRNALNEWAAGIVQVLFHQDQVSRVLTPLNSKFNIKPTRFYKEDNYRDTPFFYDKCFLLSLNELSVLPAVSEHEKDQKYGQQPADLKEAKPVKEKPLIEKHKIAARESEVDLHISALVDDYSHLHNNEILETQLAYFERALDSAFTHNYKRVVFIHGIGNGTLKGLLRDKLKDYGDEITIRNAAFAQYGMGAIEILIHQNE